MSYGGSLTSAALAGAGAGVLLNDNRQMHTSIDNSNETPSKISLWQFSRLYTVGGIPIIDFIIIYILLYIINLIYLHFDYKLILIATLPITIIFNLLVNKKVRMNGIFAVIIFISVFYLLTVDIQAEHHLPNYKSN